MDKKTPEQAGRLYVPGSNEPFKLSRSKLSLFMECQRCFYIELRYGISRPDTPAYSLNVAVDTLLKREFDAYRKRRTVPPLLEEHGIQSTLSRHPNLKRWRSNAVGVQYRHPATNFLVFGAPDDLWEDRDLALEIVDYKATARKEPVVALDQPYHISYKRQVEIYQWLLRMNGEKVSDTAYFLYCTARTNEDRFRLRLKFDATIIPHQGDCRWVEMALKEAWNVLNSSSAPERGANCRFCDYRLESSKKTNGRR